MLRYGSTDVHPLISRDLANIIDNENISNVGAIGPDWTVFSSMSLLMLG